jgi:integrase/recombinase XerD
VRDRLLFGLAAATGARIGELLQLDFDDLDLTRDDEHLLLHGKGGRQRRILIADPKLIVLLRKHVRGISHGPVFRAEFHDTGRHLTYASAHDRWVAYCRAAGVTGTIHQLRHSHGTQLVNAGVPLEVIRKRLGHRRMDTTLLYADVSDPTSDAVLRAWRKSQR